MAARVTLPLLLALLLLAAAGRPARAAAPVQHDIRVELDYPSGVASVDQTVRYLNRSGAPLATLALNVTPRHFGAFELVAATVGGRPVQAALDGVTLELPLPTPLAPGATAEVRLSYRLRVPARQSLRFGRAGGVLALGNWHATVQVLRGGRWPRDPYTDVGDAFFTESADYDVELVVTGASASLKVAHSGELVERAGNRWRFQGRLIRDFALALSERYEMRQQVVGGTTVTAFYLPEHAAGGARLLETAAATLAWASERLGPYPYASLQVAESVDPSGTGQEYPNVVFMSSAGLTGATGPGSYLAYVVAHEVLHQWFYALVGNDQVREPWLDEGPTTHLAYLYLRSTAPDAYASMWANMTATHRQAVQTWGDRPLDSTIYDFASDGQYFALLYRKGALFLDELRVGMGDAAYFGLLRDYVARNRYGVATTRDFLTLAAARAPADFPALVRRSFTAGTHQAVFGAAPPPPPTAAPMPPAAPSATATRPAATPTRTALPTTTPSASPTSPASVTPAGAPSPTATPAPSATPTSQPTATPSPTATPVAPPAATPPPPARPAAPLGPSPTAVAAGVGWEALAAAVGLGAGGVVAYAVGRRRG